MTRSSASADIHIHGNVSHVTGVASQITSQVDRAPGIDLNPEESQQRILTLEARVRELEQQVIELQSAAAPPVLEPHAEPAAEPAGDPPPVSCSGVTTPPQSSGAGHHFSPLPEPWHAGTKWVVQSGGTHQIAIHVDRRCRGLNRANGTRPAEWCKFCCREC